MKILACADIHLGRIPAVPSSTDLTNTTAWDAVVETAIRERVDVLAIAGDVIDQDDAWFEAYGPLLKQVRELEEHGIAIVTVAGNHDHKVFPRLAAEAPSVHILGLGGRWEALDIAGTRFVGWSFPSATHNSDPFAKDFDPGLLDAPGPVLGLLHCNVDGKVSSDRYAPVPANRFQNSSQALWVLGHIHKQKLADDYLYCGSPMALDSSECGPHGAWLLESQAGAWGSPRFIQLCPYRFEECEIPLDTAVTQDTITGYIQDGLQGYADRAADEQFSGKLYCKLTFTGIVSPAFDLQSLTGEQLAAWEFPEMNGIELSPLPDYDDKTSLELDLEELAQGVGPKALLARKLLDIGADEKLIAEMERMKEESMRTKAFSLVQELDDPDESMDTRELIRRAGMKLLRSMAAQGANDE